MAIEKTALYSIFFATCSLNFPSTLYASATTVSPGCPALKDTNEFHNALAGDTLTYDADQYTFFRDQGGLPYTNRKIWSIPPLPNEEEGVCRYQYSGVILGLLGYNPLVIRKIKNK